MANRSASVVEISTISSWARSGSDDPEPEFAPSDSFGDRLAWPLSAGLARSEVRDLASGFIFTSDGYVISSAHVLSGRSHRFAVWFSRIGERRHYR
ncbi:hypothetical protein [Polaromonas sp.]|uniref:hypothetical protein n=1 Tax=Polaromonas sp. TaxID=1869339 RepID=UPI002FCA46C6